MALSTEDKIHVLLVDDIPETRENLRKLLYFEKDIEVVAVATSGEEALRLAKQYQPEIILMDINMPGMDGVAASAAISASVPGAQIIMMSVQGETEYLRRSMLAGAKDFLIKPFSGDEMVNTIRRVHSLRPRIVAPVVSDVPSHVVAMSGSSPKKEDLGKIIAVFSPKGGVGCSILATNLAIALRSMAECRVALVDCSLQFGDIGVLLNLTSNHTIAELGDKRGHIDAEVLDIILTPHVSGVRVLLPPAQPEQADLLTADHLREMFAVLRRMFDYVIVDTASVVEDKTLAIFDLADRILLLTTPSIPAIKSARLFFEVTGALGYDEDKIRLILNRAERQSGIGPEEIAASIKHPVTLTIPADERAAIASVNQGIPLVMNNRNSPIAQGALKLAQALALELSPTAEAVATPAGMEREPAGILGRLLRK